jgi:hypothetical protein
MFSSDGALGVHRSSHTTLAVIMSPVGPYFRGAWHWPWASVVLLTCSIAGGQPRHTMHTSHTAHLTAAARLQAVPLPLACGC